MGDLRVNMCGVGVGVGLCDSKMELEQMRYDVVGWIPMRMTYKSLTIH